MIEYVASGRCTPKLHHTTMSRYVLGLVMPRAAVRLDYAVLLQFEIPY